MSFGIDAYASPMLVGNFFCAVIAVCIQTSAMWTPLAIKSTLVFD